VDLGSLVVVAFGELLGHEGNVPDLTPVQAPARYFNLAHCACSQKLAAQPGYLETTYALSLSVTGAPARPGDIWVGAACDTSTTQCHLEGTIADLSAAGPFTPEVPIIDLMEPEAPNLGCDMRAITGREWLLADLDADGIYDSATSATIVTDALPPPLPLDFAATTGSDFIDLMWTPPADVSDIYAYQVLCATPNGAPVFTGTPPAPEYVTPRQLCGLALDAPLQPRAIIPDDNTDIHIPQEIAELDPSVICGETLDPNASELRIDHLRASSSIVVLLAVVDRSGNVSAAYFHPTLATTSADGGCCNATGGQPPIALLLAMLAIRTGTGRRRSRRSAFAGTTPSAPPPTRTRRARGPASATR